MNLPGGENALARFRHGDEAALSELYDLHSDLLYSLILRILRDEGDSEDVLQETWVQAWAQRDRWNPDRGSFLSWMVTIARSRALDRVRRREARREKRELHSEEILEVSAQSAGSTAETAAPSRQVQAALEALDPQKRRAIELAFWGGLSHSKISETLDAPLGTVKSWVRNGLIDIRRQLPKEDPS